MPTVKTAISIDRDLFDEINSISHKTHIPRSRLFSQAVENFIKQKRNILFLQRLNEVYSSNSPEEELSLIKASKRRHHRIFKGLWK